MKQPKNRLAMKYRGREEYFIVIESQYITEAISKGATKRAALKAAIKRLHRLAADAEKMLDKL